MIGLAKSRRLIPTYCVKLIDELNDGAYYEALQTGDLGRAQRIVDLVAKSIPDMIRLSQHRQWLPDSIPLPTVRIGMIPPEARSEALSWDFVSMSPHSRSFYSKPGKSWTETPDGILRLADHWDFRTEDGEFHAGTNIRVENGVWALGRRENRVYVILRTYDDRPPAIARDSRGRVLSLSERFPSVSKTRHTPA